MLTSELIAQLRRKYQDNPKSAQVIRAGDNVATLFNVGRNRVPVMENSFSVYQGTSAQVETTDYTLDKDTGDLQTTSAVATNVNLKVNFKYANFRDRHWVEAINSAIDKLNARGFFRQTVRSTSGLAISANQRVYDGPSGAVDIYEILQSSDQTSAGVLAKLPGNYSYQEDANKIVLGYKPSRNEFNAISYLRKLNKYTDTSATVDIRDEWLDLIVEGAGEYYFDSMASRTAMQGNASVKEGHMSYTSLRAQAREKQNAFDALARRMKPTRPSKAILFRIEGGGNA